MVAIVERTHSDVESHQPLGEVWIVDHTNVPPELYTSFLFSGIPPLNYVFVEYTDPTRGFGLVSESDLDLIDRVLMPGDVVKRNPQDTNGGTVIDVSEVFTLAPVLNNRLRATTPDVPTFVETFGSNGVASSCMNAPVEDLIVDVPIEEVTGVADFVEGDQVLSDEWLGVVVAAEPEVILLLEDGTTVQVDNPNDLELAVPRYSATKTISKPTVQDRHLPDSNLLGSHSPSSIPCSGYVDQFYPGQAVITNKTNVREGVFIHGEYNPRSKMRGNVIHVRVAYAEVQWLCPSPFAAGPHATVVSPPPRMNQDFEFGKFMNKKLRLYDPESLPSGSNGPRTGSAFEIGSPVRFRQPEAAQEKYKDVWQPTPPSSTSGFDLNVFRIVRSKSKATVLWSDSTVTIQDSTSLSKFVSFDTDLFPTQFVASKDDISRRNGPMDTEEDQCLCLNKVGIVQSVDAKERVASVRWFESPKVQVARAGTILIAGSTFGKIGDEVTDVSYYELVKYPVLDRILGDFVIVPPSWAEKLSEPSPDGLFGPAYLRGLFPTKPQNLAHTMAKVREALLQNGAFKISTDIQSHLSKKDWVGQVVKLGLDGTVTVRLGGVDKVFDKEFAPEDVLVTIDASASEAMGPPSFELPPHLFNVPNDMMIDLTHPPDDVPMGEEDGWTTDDGAESGDISMDEDYPDTEGEHSPALVSNTINAIAQILGQAVPPALQTQSQPQPSQSPPTESVDWYSILSSALPTTAPAKFAFLETSPPLNHAFLSKSINTSPTLLRKLTKEYKILSSSLPDGIYVRTWESRLDIFRVLIVGPTGTPYELAPFIIDFWLGGDFPASPPVAYFHSWTNGQGRINPNLYEDGKICLSILGTWPGKGNDENWDSQRSSLLQVLVSLVGLVLVKEPYYNEAGFDSVTPSGAPLIESIQYTEKSFIMTRAFVRRALSDPVPGFEDVLAWLYLPTSPGSPENASTPSATRDLSLTGDETTRPDLLNRIIALAEGMKTKSEEMRIEEEKGIPTSPSASTNGKSKKGAEVESRVVSPYVGRLSRGAVLMLQKQMTALKKVRDEAWEKTKEV